MILLRKSTLPPSVSFDIIMTMSSVGYRCFELSFCLYVDTPADPLRNNDIIIT